MVVRMRATKSHRNNRRAHFKLVAPRFSICASCKRSRLAHAVCPHCGAYRGRTVVNVQARIDKKLKKRAEKEKATR